MKKMMIIIMVFLFCLTSCIPVSSTEDTTPEEGHVECIVDGFYPQYQKTYYLMNFLEKDSHGCFLGIRVDGSQVQFCGPLLMTCIKK